MQIVLRISKWLGAVLLLLAIFFYFNARSGLKLLDEHARAELGGNYLSIPQGVLSYTLEGPAEAPLVILVHGFSTPKFVWEQVTAVLLDAGHRVLTYDHFGRGFSDRPDGPYDSAFYQSELTGLIQGLDLETPLTLVGYSMGGANVVDFAASNPALVDQLVLIAPAGYMPNSGSISLLGAPVLGEWLATVFGKQYALSSIRQEVEVGLAPPDMAAKFEQQAQFDGYTQALLSTLRSFPMADQAHRYKIIGDAGIPVTAIWGTDDQVVPFSGAQLMLKDVPQLDLVSIVGGNHNMTYSRAGEIAQQIVWALSGDGR
ncbi:MAG: pimeloyl-ACP methyl ester carboxylesterase [Halioglobus sp.]|jgi:pimeloyl-ACP methyl ester carboxylesterase